MDLLLLTALSLLSALFLAWGLRQGRGRLYQYPFLSAAVFAGWVVPSAIGLLGDRTLPPGGLSKFLLMAILCLLMGVGGYLKRPRRRWRFLGGQLSLRRLTQAAVVLSAVGAVFHYLIQELPEELTIGGWTGLPVAYNFFRELLTYGFAVAAFVFLRSGSRVALAVAVIDLVMFAERILVAARRGFSAEILFILVGLLWFERRVAIPRWLAAVGVVTASLFLFSTAEYRALRTDGAYVGGERSARVAQIDWLGNLTSVLEEGGPEVRNAVFEIAAVDRAGDLTLGASFWNNLVFRYVPAQLVGSNVKRSLMIGNPEDYARRFLAYLRPRGTTITGMSDSYTSFWFFGSLIFLAIGVCLRQLYDSATQGQGAAEILYCLLAVDALHSITHHSDFFFLPWLHLAAFLGPVFWWSRERTGSRARTRANPPQMPSKA